MTTTPVTPVSVDEYLNNRYEPDVDYVDGKLEERNVGEIEHSDLVMALSHWLQSHAREWQIRVRPDVRIQVAPTRFRVPDIALCSRSSQDKRIVQEAPLVVVEVLSPEDRIGRYQQRIADYRGMGIRAIWTVDPQTQRGWDCSSGNWIEATQFRLPPIFLDLTAIFAELER